jgi:hypothetical protein
MKHCPVNGVVQAFDRLFREYRAKWNILFRYWTEYYNLLLRFENSFRTSPDKILSFHGD